MRKLPNAGVGNSNLNVFFESTVTTDYCAYLIVHSTTCNKRHIYSLRHGRRNLILWLRSSAKQR